MRAQSRKFTWQKAGGPLLLACAFFYIGVHAISGDHGLLAWFKETRRLAVLQAELADVTERHQAFERKVQLLSNHALDLDMLDEEARAELGFARSDEIIILTPAQK